MDVVRPGADRGAGEERAMSFDRPWFLLAALLPLGWAALAGRRSAARGRLVLKALALAAIAVALAGPALRVYESKMAVAILADTSDSVSPADLERASSLAGSIESARGRNWTAVIPFAQQARPAEPGEHERSWALKHTPGQAGRGTNIEVAIRDGIAALPAGRVPRLVLITDGRENLGSIARAAWQARELDIPIDTFALGGRTRPELNIESVSAPGNAFTGERFPIDLAVNSPRKTRATVQVKADGKLLGSSPVTLEPGSNQVRVHTSIASVGAVDLSGTVAAEDLGEVRFAQALTLRRPRLLFVSNDPPGTDRDLRKALEAAQFEVAAATQVPAGLDAFQIVVLNNQNLAGMATAHKEALEKFVQEGGGLVVIGGERNVYRGAQVEDPLERTLPASIAPPRTPEGTCVVLILDKSSSMEGRKIELARAAAVGVVENLRPYDKVGVLMFDNSFHWAVPIRRADDKPGINRIIAGIVADGGTQIAPALEEGYRRILPVNSVYKHIVLLTDGISEEGDSVALAREASAHQVTISTVGLGQDVNRSYLEKIASSARGKSYFLSEPSGLEQILLRDVQEHTGSTAIEKDFQPTVVKNVEILNGVGMETAPSLLGYVRFTAKPTADVILDAGPDPLLVRWQYGLGRAEVFTSDAKSRWAKNWVTWSGFDKFWENAMRDLLPHAQAGEVTAEYNSANDELVVDYRLSRNVAEPAKAPDIFVFGPQGFEQPLKLEKIAAGAYRGRVKIDQRKGLFRIRPLVESRAFPETGFYREEPELNEYGSDAALLRRVAQFTGGRFEPAARDIFDPGARRALSVMRLWPGLIALAILLNLIELTMRKWRGIAERVAALFRRRPQNPAAAA
jgi:Ca-activated chloride channel family protein